MRRAFADQLADQAMRIIELTEMLIQTEELLRPLHRRLDAWDRLLVERLLDDIKTALEER